jgi:hypothetical protein
VHARDSHTDLVCQQSHLDPKLHDRCVQWITPPDNAL